MKKIITLTTIAAMLTLSATAQADHRRHHDDDDADYAEVLSSQPIYHDVRVAQPREQCYRDRVVVDDGYRDRNREGVGALLGAVVGGVVGNRFGHGGGRVATTTAGAVIGAAAGASIGRNTGDRDDPRYGYEQHCNTVNDYHYERQIDGYDVSYRYHGRIYQTRLPYDPGDRLAVNVNVTPAGY